MRLRWDDNSEMNREFLQAWLLRITGAMEILAFIAVVMPQAWMEGAHAWLGLGAFPGAPVTMFMIRQASYTYGMHGVSLWVLASNVERFRPLILFNGWAYLLAGPVFFLIDYTSGLPLWWTVIDSFGCGFFGVALLWLNLTSRRDSVVGQGNQNRER